MSEESQKTDVRHIHRQMKAVCPLIQPEYQHTFHKVMKFLELQLVLQELTGDNTQRFQASSVSSGPEFRHRPCDLTAFVRAVAPVCNEKERAFLSSLQNTEQTIRMMEQVRQFQSVSREIKPEDLMMQFMTPGQQKSFQEFDRFYSSQEPKQQKDQEVPHGSG